MTYPVSERAVTDHDASLAQRWECRCRQPPVLLGTVDRSGRVNIKIRDRYWHIEGRVWTHCPKCGTEHMLDPRSQSPSG